MIARLPELVPISDLRTRQAEVLANLAQGPVILTQHSKAAAVLISTEQYNEMVTMLEDLQDVLDAREARRDAGTIVDIDDYLTRRGEVVPVTSDEPGPEGSRPSGGQHIRTRKRRSARS